MADLVAGVYTVQVSKQGVGQLSRMRCVARDVQRHGMQFVPVAADEVLPGAFVPRGAAASQNEFFQTQSTAEIGGFIRRSQREILTLNIAQDRRKLRAIQPISHSAAAFVEGERLLVSQGGLGGCGHAFNRMLATFRRKSAKFARSQLSRQESNLLEGLHWVPGTRG